MRVRGADKRSGPLWGILRAALLEEGMPDADPRDYVILRGSELLTCRGEYRVTSRLDGREVDPTNLVGDGEIAPIPERRVLHRRALRACVGREASLKFWRFGHRTRR